MIRGVIGAARAPVQVAGGPDYVGFSGAFNNNTTSVTVPTPAGVAPGDTMIAIVANANGTKTFPVPAGWAQIFSYSSISTFGMRLYSRTVQLDEPATHRWVCDGAYGDYMSAALVAYSGVSSLAVGTRGAGAPSPAPSLAAPAVGTLLGLYAFEGAPIGTPVSSADWPMHVGDVLPTMQYAMKVGAFQEPDLGPV